MNSTEKVGAAVVAAVLTLIIVSIGLLQGWAVWVWLPLGLLPPAAALLITRAIGAERERQYVLRRSMDEQPADPQVPPPYQQLQQPPQPARQEALTDIPLRSADADYRFLFSATVCWIPDTTQKPPPEVHANPGALARDAIVTRAEELLVREQPEEYRRATERLNATLGFVMSVPRGHLYVWATNVVVSLSESDRERLRRLADVRKEEQVREYLAQDVLRDPGRAVVWWLSRNIDKDDAGIRSAVGNIDNLRLLTSAAHDTEVPGRNAIDSSRDPETRDDSDSTGNGAYPHSSATGSGNEVASPLREGRARRSPDLSQQFTAMLDGLLGGRDEDEKTLFFDSMACLFDRHEMPDYATRLRHRAEPDQPDTAGSDARPASAEDTGGGTDSTGTNGVRTDAPDPVGTPAPTDQRNGNERPVEQHPGTEPSDDGRPPTSL